LPSSPVVYINGGAIPAYAQAQSQSSHSHGCDPEACMLLVCGHETKLGYYCLSSKISFGAKSRVRYVPISLCKEPKVTRNLTYALAYAKVTRIWIFRTSGVGGWDQTQRERDLLRYIRLYTSKQQQASNNNCVGAAVTRYTRDCHWHRIFARLRCAGPCVADGCLAGARSSLA
jgi:hypothetical protein